MNKTTIGSFKTKIISLLEEAIDNVNLKRSEEALEVQSNNTDTLIKLTSLIEKLSKLEEIAEDDNDDDFGPSPENDLIIQDFFDRNKELYLGKNQEG
jgi:hypothetical protein